MDYIFIAAIYLLNIAVLYHIITSCYGHENEVSKGLRG